MASIGLLLADWSIELIRSKRQKEKQKKVRRFRDGEAQTITGGSCLQCQEKQSQIKEQTGQLVTYRRDWDQLRQLIHIDSHGINGQSNKELVSLANEGPESSPCQGPGLQQLIDHVTRLIQENRATCAQLETLRAEESRLAESVGRQLQERDTSHADSLRELELLAEEKEKQLLDTISLQKQQLAELRKEEAQLRQQLAMRLHSHSNNSLEEEVDSLRTVLHMRGVEMDQLRAANNTLLLELERWRGVEYRLQEQSQRVEEMEAVINIKNQEIRFLTEKQDKLQHLLDIEESAHLSCQQELERSQWALDNFLENNRNKMGQVMKNKMTEKTLILDLVHKDQSVAYSINC